MKDVSIIKQEFQNWNLSAQNYSSAGYVPVVEKCFAYMFTNVGDTIATVNGIIIHPSATPATDIGESRTIMAHKNDLYKGRILLSFAMPLGLNPLVEIVQLFYIDIK